MRERFLEPGGDLLRAFKCLVDDDAAVHGENDANGRGAFPRRQMRLPREIVDRDVDGGGLAGPGRQSDPRGPRLSRNLFSEPDLPGERIVVPQTSEKGGKIREITHRWESLLMLAAAATHSLGSALHLGAAGLGSPLRNAG